MWLQIIKILVFGTEIYIKLQKHRDILPLCGSLDLGLHLLCQECSGLCVRERNTEIPLGWPRLPPPHSTTFRNFFAVQRTFSASSL